ncbi:guanylate-binding n-terminal domain containing protein [Stylonychia lemnae]|uniref:Guanylate-binding n-terminal domain containing protein n=1 Tax=Stylonychia lemnae TaxID=5949 RepID=A0A078A5J8_STYLE|nr:guanylate-binding n-terminal domain containing protein [Stylonychia lemnae]|eukprot:CDW76855.1 guanylate-binding n-terminal domain containing protein [Stylonychia lemnae]
MKFRKIPRVISVAGKYRTGKSFLLNRVIINKRNQGFGVGPTINPCTKGLWIWGDTLEGEYQGEKLKILLIDSEGIGAFDEDENHDTKIFLLALLLCSYFIYNSMGTIDENAINNLSLISEVLGDCDPDEIAKFFPSFLWVVRDFSLRLNDLQGNSITSKEYFENSLQPQKGTSDQVETKNRIRRLVKHFFKDRDCFTLVRPVEEEKQLQSLQSMPDEHLRQEFLQSINQLRTKIFKRVRPKTLNSKFITGEMLLELCYAYTDAINTGTLPNIQNAWSYVCQNECQRAINDSISSYEQQIRKVLERAKAECNEELISKDHRHIKEQAVQNFKQKAVGQEIQEFELQLRDGISKKHKEIKLEFIRFCKSKAYAFLENDVQNLKRNLQNDMYDSIDKFLEDIDKLKQKYNESGPIFSGRLEIFSEISQALISKAADFLTISSKKESDVSLKKLKERVSELEREKAQLKIDYSSDKKILESKIIEFEIDKNNSVRNEKLLEERLRYLQEDKDKSEKSIIDKWKEKFEEKNDQIRILDNKIRVLENQLKLKEDDSFKKTNEFEKLNALIEQKLQLTEKELVEYKQKYSAKDTDYKEINKELYNSRKEVQQLVNQLHRMEQEKNDEIKQLKQEHEFQLNQASSGNPQVVSDDQQQKWIQERQTMQIQLNLLTDTLESQKKIQESLLQALNFTKQHQIRQSSPERDGTTEKVKAKNKELVVTNQNLSQQIVQMQSKQMNLEKSISNLKQFKYMIHYAIAMQCKNCNKLYPVNQYSQHLPACNRENERVSTLNAQQNIYPINVMIVSVFKQSDEYNYDIQVDKNGQVWRVSKRLNEFRMLFEELYNQFPTYTLPFIPDEWLQNATDDFMIKDLRKKLQVFMMDLVKIPFIRGNQIFKQFLEMDQNYIEEEGEFDQRRTTFQSMGGVTGGSSMSTTLNSGRPSIMNPFSSGQQQISMISKNMDGRKSVTPVLNTQILSRQQQDNIVVKKSNIVNQSLYNMRDYIQELVDDEDHSSIASNNRISQMMLIGDDISSRPSVFSVKNQDARTDNIFSSKNNSPFQHIDVNKMSQNVQVVISKSKERYSQRNLVTYENENMSVPQDHNEFEDSFTNDIADMSVSSKKNLETLDDEIFTQRSNFQDQQESPLQADYTRTKSNLMKKFEQADTPSLMKKGSFNRYEANSEDEDDLNQRENQNKGGLSNLNHKKIE